MGRGGGVARLSHDFCHFDIAVLEVGIGLVWSWGGGDEVGVVGWRCKREVQLMDNLNGKKTRFQSTFLESSCDFHDPVCIFSVNVINVHYPNSEIAKVFSVLVAYKVTDLKDLKHHTWRLLSTDFIYDNIPHVARLIITHIGLNQLNPFAVGRCLGP